MLGALWSRIRGKTEPVLMRREPVLISALSAAKPVLTGGEPVLNGRGSVLRPVLKPDPPVSEPVSPVPAIEDPVLASHDAETHAERLLKWFQEDGGGHEVDAKEVLLCYREMCADLCWEERPWNSVGRYFAKLTGGKTYKNVASSNGQRRNKKRIYNIPPVGSEVVPWPELEPGPDLKVAA